MDSAIVSAFVGGGRGVGVTIASHSSLAPTRNVRRWMVSIRREITDREEDLQQAASAALGQQGAELGQHTLILWCATIGHDLLHRREARALGHAALAGFKPRSADLHRSEQRTEAALAADPSAASGPHIKGSVAGPGSAPRLAPAQEGAAGRPGPPSPLRATIPASAPSSRAWR